MLNIKIIPRLPNLQAYFYLNLFLVACNHNVRGGYNNKNNSALTKSSSIFI